MHDNIRCLQSGVYLMLAPLCNCHCCAEGVDCRWLDSNQDKVVQALLWMTQNQDARVGYRPDYVNPLGGKEGTMYLAVRRLFALCITGRKVSRDYRLPAPHRCHLQVLEADGLIELHEDALHAGEQCQMVADIQHMLYGEKGVGIPTRL